MTVIDASKETIPDLATELSAIGEQIRLLAQRMDVQDAIQIEIAKLLQSFHAQHQALPEQITTIVKSGLDAHGRDKLPLTNEVLQKIDARFNHLAASVNTLKQATNLTLREMPSRGSKIRCIFLVQSIPMWDALADVYWAMTKDDRFHPIVVSINQHILGSAEATGEEDVHQGLNAQSIPHLRMNVTSGEALDILRNLTPDVIFRQQQWERGVPGSFRTPEITFARVCVVPYGMGLLADPNASDPSQEAHPDNYDQLYHRMAWRVFCVNEQTQSYFRSFAHSDPEKYVLSGYPKLDRLKSTLGKGVWPIAEPNGRSFRVVWAPHHSFAGEGVGFGVFHKIYRQMLEWARREDRTQFVFKPHPALVVSATRSKLIANPGYNDFLNAWSQLPNCAISEGDYGSLFDASDILLTDGVSFLNEYPIFGKPLIFIDSKVHTPFDALGRLGERAAHRVETFDEMRKAALGYRDGKPWPYDEERDELLRMIMPLKEAASGIILNSIVEGFSIPQ